tara:strand:- start:1727 stop:2128 length:402 start_codon:yes stop_codon:yes gene_type:complete
MSEEKGENHPSLKVKPTALIPKNSPEKIAINSSSSSILIRGANNVKKIKIKTLFTLKPVNKEINISWIKINVIKKFKKISNFLLSSKKAKDCLIFKLVLKLEFCDFSKINFLSEGALNVTESSEDMFIAKPSN